MTEAGKRFWMNQQQSAYAEAKAAKEAAAEMFAEAEQKYIQNHGIKNADGTTPRNIYSVDCPEDEWDAINEAAYEDPEFKEAADISSAATAALLQAENDLVDWSLSIIPAGLRETLEPARKQYKVREKLIDLAFRLDARTVPQGRSLK